MTDHPADVSVLVVEDNPADFRLLVEAVRNAAGPEVRLTGVERLADAVERLARERVDVLLLDLSLPDCAGFETFARARHAAPHLPIVVLTGLADDDLGVRAVLDGAQDFLVKGQVDGHTLVRSIRFALAREKLRAELLDLAMVDPLTRLLNRRGFDRATERQILLGRRRGSGLWLLYADIDGLKAINDRHGHRAGDAALVAVADGLRDAFRGSDVLGRLGGDEFGVVAVDAAPASGELLVRRLRATLADRTDRYPLPFPLALSVGAARFDPGAGASLATLTEQADRAMYEDKRRRTSDPPGPARIAT
jgi:diguanylate cyclase (GGDEF)-like protein